MIERETKRLNKRADRIDIYHQMKTETLIEIRQILYNCLKDCKTRKNISDLSKCDEVLLKRI